MYVKNILCPIDFSETSAIALEVASDFARDTNAKLHIAHIGGDPSVLDLPLSLDEKQNSLNATLPTATNVTFAHHLLFGPEKQTILDFIQDNEIDLVVVGSHGRTGIRRALLGSFAEMLIHHSPAPVLVVRHDMSRVHPMTRDEGMED